MSFIRTTMMIDCHISWRCQPK